MDSSDAGRDLESQARYYVPDSEEMELATLELDSWWIDQFVKGPKVLEMGCSQGVGTKLLLNKLNRLTVVEGSKHYCEHLKQHIEHPGLEIIHSLYECFEPKHRFNDIVLARSLDYMEDPIGLLKRIKPWLAHKGRLHLVVQNAGSVHRRVGVASGNVPKLDTLTTHSRKMGHRRIYTLKSLLEQLELAGYGVAQANGYLLKPFNFDRLKLLAGEDRRDLIRILYEVGKEMPTEICNQLYVQGRVC